MAVKKTGGNAMSKEVAESFSNLRVKENSFAEACEPLIQWLRKWQHPHCCVTVTQTGAELLEGQINYKNMEGL